MFLQVLRLSDLCMGSGDQLLTGNWRKYQPLPSRYKWPKAVQPSTADWNTWELALATAFNIGRNQTLPRQMGDYFQSTYMGWYFAPEEMPCGTQVAATGDDIVRSHHAHGR